MTLGMAVLDFLRLRELMPGAALVDRGPVVRRLMSRLTSLEVDRLRRACHAGAWVHAQVPHILRSGMIERELAVGLGQVFAARYGSGYEYDAVGSWTVGSPDGLGDPYHPLPSDRRYGAGDLVFRGWSGARYRGYAADIDRDSFVGTPPARVRDQYRIAWEANRAMAEMLVPVSGALTSTRPGHPWRSGMANRAGSPAGPGTAFAMPAASRTSRAAQRRSSPAWSSRSSPSTRRRWA
jgi:Xaa-Pro aminopeptidase